MQIPVVVGPLGWTWRLAWRAAGLVCGNDLYDQVAALLGDIPVIYQVGVLRVQLEPDVDIAVLLLADPRLEAC